MTGEPTLRRLTDAADAAWAAVEQVYVDALPAGERKPVAWLRSLAGRSPCGRDAAGGYVVLVAERAETVFGFGIVFVPAAANDAALLEYLAVTAAARGGGVGGQLFAAARDAAVGRPMLVEVEADDPRRRPPPRLLPSQRVPRPVHGPVRLAAAPIAADATHGGRR